LVPGGESGNRTIAAGNICRQPNLFFRSARQSAGRFASEYRVKNPAK
jgi:hypothetical protein